MIKIRRSEVEWSNLYPGEKCGCLDISDGDERIGSIYDHRDATSNKVDYLEIMFHKVYELGRKDAVREHKGDL